MELDFTNIIPLIPDKEDMPKETAAIPPLPFVYDENDSRVVSILERVAEFCGKEFTEIPPDPDGEDNPDYDPDDPDNPENPPKEGGDIMPLDDDVEVGDGDGENEEDEEGGSIAGSKDPEHKPKPGDPDFEIDPDDPDKEGQIDPDIPGQPYPDGTGEDPNPDLDDLRDKYKKALEDNAKEKAEYWALLWQVLRLISNMACWTDTHDDTFIVQYRTQSFQARQHNGCSRSCCNCDEDTIVIPIEYAPLELHPDETKNHTERIFDARPFIKGVISVIVRGKREEVVIDQSYLNERYDPFTQKLYINREDFPDILYNGKDGCCCLCERELNITLFYNAGYYMIPEALLPLICQLMGKIEDSKLPLSDCTAALSQVSGLLKSMKLGNIQYTWSDIDDKLSNTQALFTEIYNTASLAELFGLSRCNLINKVDAGDVI